MLADVGDASKQVRFSVAGVGVCDLVMRTQWHCSPGATYDEALESRLSEIGLLE